MKHDGSVNFRLHQGLAIYAVVFTAAHGLACKSSGSPEAPAPSQSPQATAIPAQLATSASIASAPTLIDAGPPATALRGDIPPSSDSVSAMTSGVSSVVGPQKDPAREVFTLHLEGILHPLDAPASRRPETLAASYETLRKRAETQFRMDLGFSRMVTQFTGAYLFPSGVRLRARMDRLGFLAETPEQDRYRTVSPGVLRVLFNEGRFDAAPLLTLENEATSIAGKWQSQKTRRIVLKSALGNATIDIAKIDGATDSGTLVLRMLAEWLAADGAALYLSEGDVPVHAEYKWISHGGFVFDVSASNRRTDLAPAAFACPQDRAQFDPSILAGGNSGLFFSTKDLGQLRATTPERVTTQDDEGLLFSSAESETRIALVEGIAVAAVAGRASFSVPGLRHGTYGVALRTFFDDRPSAAGTTQVPGGFGERLRDAGR